jgi:hydroxylamine dehydrogenase
MKTVRMCLVMALGAAALLPAAGKREAAPPSGTGQPADEPCLGCHAALTPNIVEDWRLSRHAAEGVDCSTCHGAAHSTATDAGLAGIPTPDTCALCHPDRVAQFSKGKHALAWSAMQAMPTIHWQPMALTEGLKGCGGCHKLGLKSEQQIRESAKGGYRFGVASCDACHTRHTFARSEAREPEACQTCHQGFDHAQWEMYSGSKHGVRHALKQLGVLPANAAAPTCQTCHLPDGDHAVQTAWGFLAVRLPLPEDRQWAADRVTILKALNVLDPAGQPTARLEVVKGARVARLSQEEWQESRERMLAACLHCHSEEFARGELAKGDDLIRDADRLMAQAIEEVAGLYRDGLLRQAQGYARAYPDLLTFHDAPTPIEQRLFRMFLEHRMRTFQGSFHANPDYALWYGWSEMVQDLAEIRSLARELRSGK